MKERTKRREVDLKKMAPNMRFVSINECEFDEMYKNLKDDSLKERIELEIKTTFPDPRSFYFGGRVNAIVLKDQCEDGFEMKYMDYTSLYPSVMKNDRYGFGHPEITKYPIDKPPETDIKDFFGLVTCEILPPAKLHIPIIPARCRGKLYFPLCQTCMEESNEEFCQHSDNGRILTGTWGTPELELAESYGYKIKR
jgi:hypothetical protein